MFEFILPLESALRLALLWLLVALGVASCAPAEESLEVLDIAAAASLQRVAEELSQAFEAKQHCRTRINCAGTNALAKQIEAAGRTDVLLSADQEWVEYLSQKNCIWEGSQLPWLSNQLVVVAHPDFSGAPQTPQELVQADFLYLALANPASVPAGRYAKRMLESIAYGQGNLWQALEARVAPCLDVRAALAMVAAHPRVLGIVYSSEAERTSGVRRLLEIPAQLQPEILYSAALVRRSDATQQPSELAVRFIDFLSSAEAQAICRANGFLTWPLTEPPGR